MNAVQKLIAGGGQIGCGSSESGDIDFALFVGGLNDGGDGRSGVVNEGNGVDADGKRRLSISGLIGGEGGEGVSAAGDKRNTVEMPLAPVRLVRRGAIVDGGARVEVQGGGVVIAAGIHIEGVFHDVDAVGAEEIVTRSA